jgi:hypothetical protein
MIGVQLSQKIKFFATTNPSKHNQKKIIKRRIINRDFNAVKKTLFLKNCL